MQVQQALLQQPEVADCAVIAAADEVMGHVPVAFVVPADDATVKPVKLGRRLRGNLPATALPSRIVVLDQIPRTGSGKAVRAALLELLEGGERGTT